MGKIVDVRFIEPEYIYQMAEKFLHRTERAETLAAGLVSVLCEIEWCTVDPDPYPCYGRCMFCGASTKEWGGNENMDGDMWTGKHRNGCRLHAALVEYSVATNKENQ